MQRQDFRNKFKINSFLVHGKFNRVCYFETVQSQKLRPECQTHEKSLDGEYILT